MTQSASSLVSTSEIDLKIFATPSSNCKNETSETAITKNCDHLLRASTALRYYSLLCNADKRNKSISAKTIFSTFCDDVYNYFLNDYIHIITKHSIDFLQIEQELLTQYGFTKCSINKCLVLRRHYGIKQREPLESHKSELNYVTEEERFYCEYFDELHHLFFHLYDIGIRVEIKKDEKQMIDISAIDKVFQNRRDSIAIKRKKYGDDIDRYHDENNKYIIKLDTAQSKTSTNNGNTVLDGLYSAISNKDNINIKVLNDFQSYCNENEYDTEAIEQDVEDFNEQSNIYNHIKNKEYYELISNFIKHAALSSISFSTGYLFVYSLRKSKNDNLLYVSPFYSTLKQEILSSNFVTITDWDDIIFTAEQLHSTDKAKTVCYNSSTSPWIEEWKEIEVHHLISVLLYCNMSALCTDFSSTFRKKNKFEPIEETKKRNSKYYNFSKLLLKTVRNFGITYVKEKGPFYCGLSCVMNMPSFAIALKAPCSTSKQIQVSLNFAKTNGMIMELQNDGYGVYVPFFDCSWVSIFSEEDERLYFGEGKWKLRMQSIRVIKTAKNYETFLHCFYLFDAMVSGVKIKEEHIKVTSTDVKILNKLLKVKDTSLNQFDKYVYDSFKLFCYNKEELQITIWFLDKYFKGMHQLVMNKISNTKEIETKEKQNVNILNPGIFDIFPNVNTITINTTYGALGHGNVYPVYEFPLLSFLSFIELNKPSITYKICAMSEYYGWGIGFAETGTWINNVFTSSIKQKFNELKWNIDTIKGDERCSSTGLLIKDILVISKVA